MYEGAYCDTACTPKRKLQSRRNQPNCAARPPCARHVAPVPSLTPAANRGRVSEAVTERRSAIAAGGGWDRDGVACVFCGMLLAGTVGGGQVRLLV